MKAYTWLTYTEHHDGTMDTEEVNLLCEECFRNEWTRRETGVADWQALRDTVIRTELWPALHRAEMEADTVEALWDMAVDYTQMQGSLCEHLQRRTV